MTDTPTSLAPGMPFADFEEASGSLLGLLREFTGLDLWMVTRVEGERWIVVSVQTARYEVEEGDVLRWSHSFCSHMVRGEAPMCAPESHLVAAYRDAEISRDIPIGSYIGLPLTRSDGALFGTLCAVDPDVQPERLKRLMPIVETSGRFLATVLDRELRLEVKRRRLERLEYDAMRDGLTGLYNRRAWEQLVAAEEERCRRYGHGAGVLIIDLDNLKTVNDREGHAAGDRLLGATAEALREVCRGADLVARLGGDEFAVLAVEIQPSDLDSLRSRIDAALRRVGAEASVGAAMRDHKQDLAQAVADADRLMYAEKRRHKAARSQPDLP